jgi:Domain of unknown function (DUF4349)
MRRGSRRVAGFVLAAGVVAVLVGCSAGEGSSGANGPSSGDARSATPLVGSAPGAAAPADVNGKAADEAVPVGQLMDSAPNAGDRELARTAKLALTAPDVAAAVGKARQIATGLGGYTGAEDSTPGSATLTLAVPVAKLDAAVAQFAAVGTVTSREESTQDVTEQSVDLASRLATQRASVARMRDLLAKANSVSDIASIESELTTREADLESLQNRGDALAGSVAMSTVTLSFLTPATPPAPAPESGGGFIGGLSDGWDAFGGFASGAFRVLGAMAPFLVLLGGPVAAGAWWLRRRRRAAELS